MLNPDAGDASVGVGFGFESSDEGFTRDLGFQGTYPGGLSSCNVPGLCYANHSLSSTSDGAWVRIKRFEFGFRFTFLPVGRLGRFRCSQPESVWVMMKWRSGGRILFADADADAFAFALAGAWRVAGGAIVKECGGIVICWATRFGGGHVFTGIRGKSKVSTESRYRYVFSTDVSFTTSEDTKAICME